MSPADDQPSGAPGAGLVPALLQLAGEIATVPDGLETEMASARREHRDRLAQDVRGMAARARDVDAPLLVVLGGVTGAGKSTVANSLVGREVVRTGVIRPTTSTPTLIVHPDDVAWFSSSRILPELPRVSSLTGEAAGEALLVVEDAVVPRGLAFVDAPDVDSVSETNRELADRLLDAADLWVWFTTVGKYADEESMRYVERAARRHTAMLVALTQVRPGDREAVLADLASKLRTVGAGGVEVAVVPWSEVIAGQLPEPAVDDLRGRLLPLADEPERRRQRQRTLSGALDALPAEVAAVQEWMHDQLEEARRLTAEAAAAYAQAGRDFADAIEEGLPLRQEVLSRWNRFVGGSRMLRLAEHASGQARSWLRSVLAATSDSREERLEREVQVEVAETVGDLAVRLGDLAAADASAAWSRRPSGQALLSRAPELDRASPELRERTWEAVRAWQDHVVELVATRGADRRTRARWLTTLVNAAATGAIVIALAQTGGLTGAEAGIATAAGAANQTLLAKLIGAQNLRWLITTAREDLTQRFDRLTAAERQRYTRVVAEATMDPEHIEELRRTLERVEDART